MSLASFLSGSELHSQLLESTIIGSVFHPLEIAKGKRFVGRERLVHQVFNSAKTKGAQILLYGAFGSGKTSVAYKVLHDINGCDPLLYAVPKIAPHENQGLRFLEGVFETIAGFPPSEMNSQKNLSIQLLGVNVNLDGSKRVFHQMLTTTSVATLVLRSGKAIIIDNLDRLSDEAFEVALDLMKQVCDLGARKELSNSNAKIVAIAAKRDVHALLQEDPAIGQRIHAHYVPLLDASDMCIISTNGFRMLNLHFDRNAILRIHYNSCRLPRMLHGICLESARLAISSQERSIGLHIQLALNNMLGYASLEREYEYISALLDKVALKAEIDPDNLLKVAVSAAMRTQDSTNHQEVSAMLKAGNARIPDVEKYLRALLDANILELARRDSTETDFRYAFVHYTHQLALRFKISDADLGTARNLREFAVSYDRLYGDGI